MKKYFCHFIILLILIILLFSSKSNSLAININSMGNSFESALNIQNYITDYNDNTTYYQKALDNFDKDQRVIFTMSNNKTAIFSLKYYNIPPNTDVYKTQVTINLYNENRTIVAKCFKDTNADYITTDNLVLIENEMYFLEFKIKNLSKSNIYSFNFDITTESEFNIYNNIGDDLKNYQHDTSSTSTITNILPKELFANNSHYSYLGDDFGYLVTTKVKNKEISTNLFLYNIYIETPFDHTNASLGTIRISPINNYRFIFVKNKVINNGFSDNNFLSNISVDINIENIENPNYGDTDYSIENDNGDFLTLVKWNSKGRTIEKYEKTKNNPLNTYFDIIGTKITCFALKSTNLPFCERGVNLLINSIQKETGMLKKYTISNFNPSEYIEDLSSEITFPNNISTYINYYKDPKLKREFSTREINDVTEQYFYKDSEDYFEFKYKITRGKNFVEANIMKIDININFDIYQIDNSSNNLIESKSKIISRFYNSNPPMISTGSIDIDIPKGQERFFVFKPKNSGNYEFTNIFNTNL